MADPLDDFGGRVARRRKTGSPLVTLTYAQSLDGSIAARRDKGLALSGDESKAMTHRLRAAHGAILVGIGTVLADNPRLTARLATGPDPQPVILDTHLRFPSGARLLKNPDLKPWVFTCRSANPRRAAQLEKAGARVFPIPDSPDGLLDLATMVTVLGDNGIDSLMVEGGARVITNFLAAKLPDWLVITIAPVFVGGVPAVEPFSNPSTPHPSLENVCSTQMGRDIVLWGDLKSVSQ